MVFTSFAFLFLFLPVFLAGYALLGRRGRNAWLLFGSLTFYGWERPEWVLIMLASSLIDYSMALAMGAIDEGRRHRRLWLIVSIVTNLGLLAWFKYANFFVHTTETLTGTTFSWREVLLPVGISFYTFQSMSYTVDVYRGDVRPTRSPIDFAAYVAMFPQLVAGPIVRYRDVHQQLRSRQHSITLFGAGATCFAAGFVKKVLLADTMVPIANAGFGLDAPGLIESWTALVAYSLRIYFDFSGYSDMAIGLGLMLGFRFPANFDSPYKSASITEAWRRWHISLSTWLRDYLYIPLGGNRCGPWRTHANLMATMLLGGLWHGANWPFVLWGAWHGAWLCVERKFHGALWSRAPHVIRVSATWLVFTLGWSMFVARDAGHLATLWGGLFGVHGPGSPLVVHSDAATTLACLALGLAIVFGAPNTAAMLRRFRPWFVAGTLLLWLLAVAHATAKTHVPFLYFQF